MTQEDDGTQNLRYLFVFPKEGDSFSVVVTYEAIRLQLSVENDEYEEDLEEVMEYLPRLIKAAKQERDIRLELLEMDDDLDQLLGEGEV